MVVVDDSPPSGHLSTFTPSGMSWRWASFTEPRLGSRRGAAAAAGPAPPRNTLGLVSVHGCAAAFAIVFVGWMLIQGIFNEVGSTIVVLVVLLYMLANASLDLRRKAPIDTPTRPRCVKCRYQLHISFPERCPECGVDLAPWDSMTFDPDEPVLAGGPAQTLRVRLQKRRWKND